MLYLSFKCTLVLAVLSTGTPHVFRGPYPAHLLVLNIIFHIVVLFIIFFLRYQTSNFSHQISPFCSIPVLPTSFFPSLTPKEQAAGYGPTRLETGGFFPGETCPGERAWEIDSWRLPKYTRRSLPGYPAWSLLINNPILSLSLSLSHTHTHRFSNQFCHASLLNKAKNHIIEEKVSKG